MAATAAAPTATTSPQRPNTNSKFTVFLRSSDRSGTLKVRLPKRKTAQAVLRAFAGAALGDASKAHAKLGWRPTQTIYDLVKEMIEKDKFLNMNVATSENYTVDKIAKIALKACDVENMKIK